MPNASLSSPESTSAPASSAFQKRAIFESITRLSGWLEEHDYRGYDTFDGLNSKYARALTLDSVLLRTVLLQGVRRFPINLRPLLGIAAERSTKGMGFLARGFIRLNRATGDAEWERKAEAMLQWLMEHQSSGYSGACWGNHFDYQARTFYLPKGEPTVVWTALIGHAFLDGWEQFRNETYLKIAISACEHIVRDLAAVPDGDTLCIAYVPGKNTMVHNANTLGASLLARTFAACGNKSYLELARKALAYTAKYQRPDGSWYYGEKSNLHWVDNFHTAYVLDCFRHYALAAKDDRFMDVTMRGYQYWKNTFFLSDGTPRYYCQKTLPLDIQCSSQAIDTFVFFGDLDPEAIPMALKTAEWTINNMQDRSGYFYYRRYSKHIVNKTPTLHWGQATMLCALGGLYETL
jgi:rhamnogalacturonyl hydrolase YesR